MNKLRSTVSKTLSLSKFYASWSFKIFNYKNSFFLFLFKKWIFLIWQASQLWVTYMPWEQFYCLILRFGKIRAVLFNDKYIRKIFYGSLDSYFDGIISLTWLTRDLDAFTRKGWCVRNRLELMKTCRTNTKYSNHALESRRIESSKW